MKRDRSKKGFAKAFKQDIGREEDIAVEKWEVRKGQSLLMNPVRREIFRYLCEFPCNHLSGISRDLAITPPTTTWHLKKMIDRDLIARKKINGKIIFYPLNMIEEADIIILALINDLKVKRIFLTIKENPGITQKEISLNLELKHQTVLWHTSKLEDVGLISTIEDGKFKRYYPTNLLSELGDTHLSKLRAFREWLIKALKYDGIAPEVIRTTDKFILLRITTGREKTTLELPTNPFSTVLGISKEYLPGG
ncbi:MAG: winged helix-turn-helix transcriptional regulator [Thermoplasmata archaeon]|nr:winged helix-turn-helix transcriptional regulator [Thermoplasmata archaeon]